MPVSIPDVGAPAAVKLPALCLRTRLRVWYKTLIVDHGLLRLLHRNWHRVGANAFRSNHPLPHQVARAARDGVKTIILEYAKLERLE